jgi:bifunctional non-homologous end joining protein LigD
MGKTSDHSRYRFVARPWRNSSHAVPKKTRSSPLQCLRQPGPWQFELAKRHGFEGVLAKDAAAPYVEGRSNKWLKFKVRQEDEFVIAGYSAPAGSRKYFGALLLAAYDDDGKLVFVGKVGTGFTGEVLANLFRMFQPLRKTTPTVINPPLSKAVTYLQPVLVAEIGYEELTAEHKLRQPVFLRLRDDKPARDVTLPKAV